jgi:hypothetical protein
VKLRGIVFAAAVLFAACGRSNQPDRAAPPHLERVVPDKVLQGEGFQVQPNGRSAIAVAGSNFAPGAKIRVNGQALASTGNDVRLSAFVPDDLTALDGSIPISVENPDGQVSNLLPFTIFARSGPPPEIAKVFPDTYAAGRPFNQQADGSSALGVTGVNFRPGAVVVLAGKPLLTAFANVDSLTATVPAALLAKPGELPVTVRNPDGKESAPAPLKLTP